MNIPMEVIQKLGANIIPADAKATREYATANLILGSLLDDKPFFFLKSTIRYREQFCEVAEDTVA